MNYVQLQVNTTYPIRGSEALMLVALGYKIRLETFYPGRYIDLHDLRTRRREVSQVLDNSEWMLYDETVHGHQRIVP